MIELMNPLLIARLRNRSGHDREVLVVHARDVPQPGWLVEVLREHVCRIDLAVHVKDANDVPSLEFLEKAYATGYVSEPFDR